MKLKQIAALLIAVLITSTEVKAADAADIEGLSEIDAKLHKAVKLGHTKAAIAAIDDGADVNAQNCYGWSPLHRATHIGSVDITTLLIARGARADIFDKDGLTPLFRAVSRNDRRIINVLIIAGANINAGKRGFAPIDAALAAKNGTFELLLPHITWPQWCRYYTLGDGGLLAVDLILGDRWRDPVNGYPKQLYRLLAEKRCRR